MAEFEEKLNAILGNQEAMGQIMTLARSLSGESKQSQGESAVPGEESWEEDSPPVDQALPDLSQLLGDLDPGILQMGMRVIQEVRGTDDRNADLLLALRPFLREERRAKLDRAVQIARMSRLIRVALEAMGRKGEEGHV